MGAGALIGKGVLQTLTGNVEKAKLILYDHREIETEIGEGKGTGGPLAGALSTVAETAANVAKDALASTVNALAGGAKPKGFRDSKTVVYDVQFNPSQLLLNSFAMPVNKASTTGEGSRLLVASPPKLILSATLLFDDMDTYDAFMTEKFTSGATAKSVANVAKTIGDISGLRKEKSVRPQVEALLGALRDPRTRTIGFQWGDFGFVGQLISVQARYTMFSTVGNPIRAEVSIRIQHEISPDMLSRWYSDFDKAIAEDSSILGKAADTVGNLFNLKL